MTAKKQLSSSIPYNTALKNCIAYFDGDELAATTWINKYAVRNEKNELLEKSPDEMHLRMAKEFARIEKKYKTKNRKQLSAYGQTRTALNTQSIFKLFEKFKYIIPQGSVMASLGNKNVIASYSNCVVLPELFDSYGGILYTDHQLAQLFKRRCGVGIDISTLRPENVHVSNAARSTSGAVSFMERFSNTTREVAQNGRRGALMITMDIQHPDIEKFITSKQDLSKVTGANISVRLSDAFMRAVEKNSNYQLQWPIQSFSKTKIANSKLKITKTITARTLWENIIRCAHNTAEPGLIFWDKQHHYSTSSVYPGYENTSTNPCSEIAMQGGDSCRLMAINLFSFVDEPFTANAKFNFQKFWEIVYEAQRLMDDLVDLELEAIERILKKVKNDPEPDYVKAVETETWKLLYNTGKKARRTGLGFTALADTLAALGYIFDSTAAIAEVEKIMKTKCEAEFESSIDLAIERGKFAAFNKTIENKSDFIKMLKKEFPKTYSRMMRYGRRNISISTVAPTGSLSILTQTSSGIEPVYMLSYKRRRKINTADKNQKIDFVDALGDAWEEFEVLHPKLKLWQKVTGKNKLADSPYKGATAAEINWEKRIELQAVIQKYVTHSISSTINLAGNTSVDEVSNIYLQAWKSGLKGITVYRDGSRSGVLIDNNEKEKTTTASETRIKRPEQLEADVVRFMNADEKWIAVIGLLDDKPYEIFTGKESDGFMLPNNASKGLVVKKKLPTANSRYDFVYTDEAGKQKTIEGLSNSFNREYWNYAKLISGVLRQKMPLPQIINLVENLNLYTENINTWKSGVIRALKRYLGADEIPVDKKCPSCSDPDGLIYEEGCLKCKSCGYSVC